MPNDTVSVFGIAIPKKEIGIKEKKPKKISVVKTIHQMVDAKDSERKKRKPR